jgi:hypothetical protein
MSTKDKNIEKKIRELQDQIDQLRGSESKTPERFGFYMRFGGGIVITEGSFIKWFRNDEFFAGFRNTPARAIITGLSMLILFGYGYYAFINPQQTFWYLGLLVVALLMQAISVRFVFNMEGNAAEKYLDEYHMKRRDKALQRANQSFNGFIGLALLGAFVYGYKDYIFGGKDLSFPDGPSAVFDFTLSGWQFFVVVIFVLGWTSLQKYWAYGIKGEPWLSKEELKKLRDS